VQRQHARQRIFIFRVKAAFRGIKRRGGSISANVAINARMSKI